MSRYQYLAVPAKNYYAAPDARHENRYRITRPGTDRRSSASTEQVHAYLEQCWRTEHLAVIIEGRLIPPPGKRTVWNAQ
jgi:hypothetical protein